MEQLNVFDCSNVLIASFLPTPGDAPTRIGNIRLSIYVPVNWK